MNVRRRIIVTCRSSLLATTLGLASITTLAAEPRNREPAGTMPAGKIELDETVISGNQELPKVLYIVPWQQPDGLPEIELRTDFAEVELFRRLYPPAYRRELAYFEAATATAPDGEQGPAEPGRESEASDSKE
jgi:hypothetical protein